MEETKDIMTLGEAEKGYYFSINAYNVIQSICKRELPSLFEGKIITLFIDSYDLISYVFPRNALVIDKHYDSTKALWHETFNLMQSDDNIRVCISPISALELFHFLEKKAYYIAKGIPVIKDKDAKNMNTFSSKFEHVIHAYTLTQDLVDREKGKIKDFLVIDELLKQRKIVKANEVFDYDKVDWKKVTQYTSATFDGYKARQFLLKQRTKYKHELRKEGSDVTAMNILGLDNFAVLSDIYNIAHTAYLDHDVQDEIFTLTSHGIYIILCCSTDKRILTWKGKKEDIPVKNSLASLYLMRAKREFDTFDEAEEHFKGAQNALHIYLKELSRIPEVKKFIESNSEQHKLSKDLTIKKTPQFKLAEQYRNTHYRFLFLGHLNREPRREKIGKTRVEEIVDFSRDRKKRLSHAENFLDASRKSLKESEIFLPEKVGLFLPTDDRTRNLLLKYKGYRISDWI